MKRTRLSRRTAISLLASAMATLSLVAIFSGLLAPRGLPAPSATDPGCTGRLPAPTAGTLPSSVDGTRSETHDHSLRTGERLEYRFSLRQRTDLGSSVMVPAAAPGAAAGTRLESLLSGRARLHVLAATSTGWTLALQLEDLGLELRGGSEETLVDRSRGVPGELHSEILLLRDRSGAISGLRFAPEVSPQARNLFRNIAAKLQVTLPPSPGQIAWEGPERDATGTCLVSYVRGAAGGAEIRRRRLKYLEAATAGGWDSPSIETSGETRLQLDGEVLISVEGLEQLAISGGGLAGDVQVEEETHLALENRSWSPAAAAAAPALLAGGRWAAAVSLAPDPLEVPDPEPLSLADLQQALDRLEELLSAEEGASPDAHELTERLLGLLRGPAGEVAARKILERALAGLRERPEAPALWQRLAGLLAEVGTPSAQEALVTGVFSVDLPVQLRATALLALAHVAKPVESLDGALESLHEEGGDLAPNALLVLGAVGARVRSSDPERAGNIARRLEDSVAADGPIALEALGNLGPGSTPAASLAAYDSEDELLRLAAVRSVRQTLDSAADRLLSRALAGDSSEAVRAEAGAALARRPRGTEAATRALAADASDLVRTRIVGALGESAGGDPASRQLLEGVARWDTSPGVRERAASLVAAR